MNGKASKQIMNFLHQENASGSVQKLVDSSTDLSALSPVARFNLMASVELISECFASLNFLDEVGHEKALLQCAIQCVDIVQKQREPLQDGLLRTLLLKVQKVLSFTNAFSNTTPTKVTVFILKLSKVM